MKLTKETKYQLRDIFLGVLALIGIAIVGAVFLIIPRTAMPPICDQPVIDWVVCMKLGETATQKVRNGGI
jgi:hypothetical protein